MNEKVTGTLVTTGVCRASYADVWTPKVGPNGGAPKYGMSILIPKDDKATVDSIKAAIMVAGRAKFGEKFTPEAIKNKLFKIGLRDGDVEKPEDAAYKGHYFINARSNNKPMIVDQNVKPILDPSAFRSGDYCRVNMNAFGFDKGGGRGVAWGLNTIQLVRRGEPLSGGPSPDSVFEKIDGGEGATADAGDATFEL